MTEAKILTETELRRLVPLDLDAVACVEAAFRALAGGGVIMPPIQSLALSDRNAEVDIKSAFLPGFDSFAVKISTGFFDNPSRGMPTASGLMVLLSAETGRVDTVLLDNGYLTDLRTAAAGAVAARALSREDAATAAILGTGLQARLQLEALCLVRPIRQAVIWGRDAAKAETLAAALSRRLGIDVRACASARDAVAGAAIVVTTTPAKSPILMADWLRPGQHVTAMGSDQHDKAELDPACIPRADLYVPDSLSQTRLLGELRAAIDADLVAAGRDFADLGSILSGRSAGRADPDEITIADLTGTGAQDTAIANLARDRAQP